MGNRLNLQYYLDALRKFSIPPERANGPTYTDGVNQLDDVLRDHGVPEVVDYLANDPNKVTLVYQESGEGTTCVEIDADGAVIAKDSYCTHEIWKASIPNASVAADVFVNAVPGREDISDHSLYPWQVVPAILPGVREIYACFLRSPSRAACSEGPQVRQAKGDAEQLEIEFFRRQTDNAFAQAQRTLSEARRREGFFSDVEPGPIEAIISLYTGNPYEGTTLLETMKGRATRAQEMLARINATESYKAILEERREEEASQERAEEQRRREASRTGIGERAWERAMQGARGRGEGVTPGDRGGHHCP